VVESFVLPIGLVAANRTFKKTALSTVIAALGMFLFVFGLWFGTTKQTLYVLRGARTLVPAVLRELPLTRWKTANTDLDAAIAQRFQRRLPDSVDVKTPASPPTPLYKPPPDIILITIDTLRRDRVFAPGTQPVMPNLQNFASNATSFTHAYAAAGATMQSLTQLMAGKREHTVPHLFAPPGATAQLDPTTLTVSGRLRRAGYWAEGFAGGKLFSYFASLAIGFDSVHELDTRTHAPLTARGTFEQLLTVLEHTPSPVFLWGHVMELHDYFQRGHQLPQRYDETAAEIDVDLGHLFDGLQKSERGRRALIIITSDHGEGLGEARMVAHEFCHSLILPIPLIVRFPDHAPTTVDTTVGHLDIAPTIMDAAGLQTEGLHGRSLGEIAVSTAWPGDHAFFEHSRYSAEVSVYEVGVAAHPWLYSYDVRLGVPILVNEESDPVGSINLAGTGLAQEQTLRRLLLTSLSRDN
jgi:hypothetical protein